jgi:tetratricopeptide (TPR) repeat protein
VLLVYAALGTVYFYQAWRTEEAFWEYALKTNPDHVSAYSNLATLKLQDGELDEAEGILLEGLAKEKGMPEEFAQAAYALGNIYGRQGDLERAEKYYSLSLTYADFEFAYMDLGFMYLDAGMWEQARDALKGALRFRRSPKVLAGLALANLRLGDKDDAAPYAVEAREHARDAELKDFAEGILKEALK